MKHLLSSILFALLLIACGGDNKSSSSEEVNPVATKPKPRFGDYYNSIVSVKTFDNDRILEQGRGFVVDSNIVAAPLSLFLGANKAVVRPLEGNQDFTTSKFIYLDRLRGVVLLRIDSLTSRPVRFATKMPVKADKVYTLGQKYKKTQPLKKGLFIGEVTIQGAKYKKLTNKIHTVEKGIPVFDTLSNVIGLGFSKRHDYELSSFIVPYYDLQKMAQETNYKFRLLSEMNSVNSEQQKKNARVKGVIVKTEMGDIKIRLFNEMPQYRDNFLKLIREKYYDSLLIHRVIPGFVVQSGAADSRYASPTDEVGWKGPGYTLPANIHPTKFHRRTMVGCPRLPNNRNSKRRSNGSQFYIVQGRPYNNEELDLIEEQQDMKFTAGQRRVYNTVGGAPTLDNQYTIFGEVTSGMEVIDKINDVELGPNYRPINDIRIRRIEIIK